MWKSVLGLQLMRRSTIVRGLFENSPDRPSAVASLYACRGGPAKSRVFGGTASQKYDTLKSYLGAEFKVDYYFATKFGLA